MQSKRTFWGPLILLITFALMLGPVSAQEGACVFDEQQLVPPQFTFPGVEVGASSQVMIATDRGIYANEDTYRTTAYEENTYTVSTSDVFGRGSAQLASQTAVDNTGIERSLALQVTTGRVGGQQSNFIGASTIADMIACDNETPNDQPVVTTGAPEAICNPDQFTFCSMIGSGMEFDLTRGTAATEISLVTPLADSGILNQSIAIQGRGSGSIFNTYDLMTGQGDVPVFRTAAADRYKADGNFTMASVFKFSSVMYQDE